jgi:hypothetical protein
MVNIAPKPPPRAFCSIKVSRPKQPSVKLNELVHLMQRMIWDKAHEFTLQINNFQKIKAQNSRNQVWTQQNI